MAGTANYELLPTDYNRVKMNGYVRKIKLKEESHASIEKKVEKFKAVFSNNTEVGNTEEMVYEQDNRAELIARLEEKINAIIPDYPGVESVKNRAIKIKSVWKENCNINAGMLMARLEMPSEEVTTMENIVEPAQDEFEGTTREEMIVAPERKENIDESESLTDTSIDMTATDEAITPENIVEEISTAMDEIPMEEEQQDYISKNSERVINSNVNLEEEPNHVEIVRPKLPEIPKIDLKSLLRDSNKSEDFEIISSDTKLEDDIESDISDKLDETYNSIADDNINEIENVITGSSDIDEMKAALESIKQKKLEQEKTNRAKQEAEEARREEEARLEEIKRKNQEAVEKIKAQREAISEDIEENLRREEEERQKAEEIRKQIELQEQLFGELESEIEG